MSAAPRREAVDWLLDPWVARVRQAVVSADRATAEGGPAAEASIELVELW